MRKKSYKEEKKINILYYCVNDFHRSQLFLYNKIMLGSFLVIYKCLHTECTVSEWNKFSVDTILDSFKFIFSWHSCFHQHSPTPLGISRNHSKSSASPWLPHQKILHHLVRLLYHHLHHLNKHHHIKIKLHFQLIP